MLIAIIQLNMLNVSDSLNIMESNPTIGAVIPKLKTRITEIIFKYVFLITELIEKERSTQLNIPTTVCKRTIAEKLLRKV